MKLSQVIEELVEEKGLDKNILAQIISESILVAYTKKYPDLELKINYNRKSDEIEVLVEKTVVTSVLDEDKEISLRRARAVYPEVNISQVVVLPFEGKVSRVDIIKIKQIIAQKIRAIEAQAIYQEFKPKEGTIVQVVIHKCERNGITVKIQDNLAFLPKIFSIPGDKCIVGYSIRALLKEVLPQPQSENQLILDRASPEFLKKLFEIEIPEVFEKLVEIKKIVRIAGYKSKVLVVSHDANIDPVGTCVGIGGVRIKPILKELVDEKIDIIPLSGSMEELIKDALKPAIINRVELLDNKRAKIWLDEDQRSLAIGRLGQNISLASKLTSIDIELVKPDLEINKE
ncbi:MAG: transcription termination factor NusA [Novosphingobium sp.]|nr:transcription termination factor NusA [Novosphingobium sp.]